MVFDDDAGEEEVELTARLNALSLMTSILLLLLICYTK